MKDDLVGWNLHRMVWVADRNFASAANRAYLTRGHYIHAEKLLNTFFGGAPLEQLNARGRTPTARTNYAGVPSCGTPAQHS